MRFRLITFLLIAVGCTENESGPAASAVVETPALSGVQVGMSLDGLRTVRPGVATAGYGIYVDSVEGYAIEYHFPGLSLSEGQNVGGSERLEGIRLSPRPAKLYTDLYANVEDKLGPPIGCFSVRLLENTSAEYALWEEPRAAVVRRRSPYTSKTQETLGHLQIGQLDVPSGGERTPCPESGG